MECVDFQSALARTKEPYSCFECVHCKRHVALPPRFVGKIKEGICEQLNKELHLYSASLQGVLISFDNIKLLQSSGVVMDDDPYVHFDIQVDFIVFRPKVGCRMKGIVNKTSVDHVGCLVYKHFNVSLPRPKLNGTLWRGCELKLGDECVFDVDHIFSRNRVLSMKGRLHSPVNHTTHSTEDAPVSAKKFSSRKRSRAEIVNNDSPDLKKTKKLKNISYNFDKCTEYAFQHVHKKSKKKKTKD